MSSDCSGIHPYVPWRRRDSVPKATASRSTEQSIRLRRLFEDTRDLAWRSLRRYGVPPEQLEDLFQQVFLIVAERLNDIALGCERAFVFGVVRRVARGYQRTGGRELLGDEPDLREGSLLDAGILVDRSRLVDLCDRILARLTPELREVFIMHELEGFSGSEIASIVGIPEGSVHSRLRRARIRVRRAVAALGINFSSAQVSRG